MIMNVHGLRDPPPGIDTSNTGDATFAGQNRCRGGGRRLIGAAVLEKNLSALFAVGLARQRQCGSILWIPWLHITAVLLRTIKQKKQKTLEMCK